MTCSNVALRTLDITHIPFKFANAEEEAFREGLVGALRRNATSLRELAVPLTETCVSALREVLLSNLEVLQLTPPVDYYENHGWTGCDYLQVFKVVQLYPRDSQGSGFELRILYFELKRVVDLDRYQPVAGFCEFVRTLHIEGWVGRWAREEEEKIITSFVSLFPQITCFRWGGRVSRKMMRKIQQVCPQLTELHLVGEQSCKDDENSADLQKLFATAGGKLRSLWLKGPLSAELVKSLGQTNPGLQTFGAEIGPDNVASLLPLLAKYCRQLHSLHIHMFNPDEDEQWCFRSEGWRKFSEAVQSASAELREVVVECGSEHGPSEPDVNDLVDSVALVLQSLKDRARIVKFHVLADVVEYGIMMGALSRLLTVASTNCPNLEQLSLRFRVGDVDLLWNSDEEKEVECRKLLRAKNQLKNVVKHLHHLELDVMDAEAEEFLGVG